MAAALRSGFLYAERLREEGTISGDDILINVDADGQHPVEEIPKAVGVILEQNLDVLLVDRDFSLYPRYKIWGNRFLTALARIVSGFPYHDVESGFRFIRVRCLEVVLAYYTGWKYSCAQEIAIITALHDMNISNSYPVRINYYRPGTTFADGFAVLTMSILTWIRVRFGLRNSPEKNRSLLAGVVAE
jgi:glycosyltransferase involved in cell wall biosynthesis